MIDVEALTNDFETFKCNCLNIDINEKNQEKNQEKKQKKYTPYLLNGKLNGNIHITNFVKLQDKDNIESQIENFKINTLINPKNT